MEGQREDNRRAESRFTLNINGKIRLIEIADPPADILNSNVSLLVGMLLEGREVLPDFFELLGLKADSIVTDLDDQLLVQRIDQDTDVSLDDAVLPGKPMIFLGIRLERTEEST